MNYRDAGLSDKEYEAIKKTLGREPNELETALIGVMWSEHCSYKSTRPLLAQFPQTGKAVAQGPGENAGVVDCGGGWGLAFKVESHNHPSAVEPYHGAATGIGGVVRDILAMGAMPAASMGGLFLGLPDTAKSVELAKEIARGIAEYGDGLRVPDVGGKTFCDPCFEGNPLVNAFNAGFVRLDSIVSSKTAKPGDLAVLLGAKTGRDGIAGASFASRELDGDAGRPRIPVGDPILEKRLIDCCLELKEAGLIASMQDMGAAGLLSSSSEIAHKSGAGMDVFCEKIPLYEAMEPWEIFLSETQERMLLIVSPERLGAVEAAAGRFALECAVLGTITPGGRYRIYRDGTLLADLPVAILGDAPIIPWPSAEPKDAAARRALPAMRRAAPEKDLLTLIASLEGPDAPVSAIRVPDTEGLVTFAMEGEPWKCWTDPFSGAAETMALALRKLRVCGAEPLGMTNCLNFPSPEEPENFHDLTECVRGLATVCRDQECPVVSGNVSLYNETSRGAIYPTPLVVAAGLVPPGTRSLGAGGAKEGDAVFLVGPQEGALGASRWQILCGGEARSKPQGMTWAYDAEMERDFAARAAETARAGIADSARALAGGGLAVALAQETVASGRGMRLDIPDDDPSAILFGEGGPRALYFLPEENRSKFAAIWEGYSTVNIGTVGGSSLHIGNMLDVSLEALESAFRGGKA